MFDVSMFVPGMPFDGETLKTKSLGGSETAALYMAKELAKLGCHIHVFCGTENQTRDEDGVVYSPIGLYSGYAHTAPHDVTIVQRMPDAFAGQTEARLNVLWCHDLALVRQSNQFRSALWNIDKVLVLSEFMQKQYEEIYGKNPGLYHLTRNGIDLSAFKKPAINRGRKRKAILYTSRPERGLDNLLQMFPRILEAEPEAELWFAGYDNVQEHMIPFYESINVIASRLPKGRVRAYGALTKAQLYQLMSEAGVYVYPTPSPTMPAFAEVSCITAMECMAAGLPIVASDVGALAETTAGAATIIPLKGDKIDADAFVEQTLKVMRDEKAWAQRSSAGLTVASRLDWASVAKDWMEMFEREIRERSKNTSAAFRHAWRTSDIMLAKQIDEEERAAVDVSEAIGPEAAARRDLNRLDRDRMLEKFRFAFGGPEGFAKQYNENIASTHTPDSFYAGQGEPRFHAMVAWMRTRKEIKTVLDYGCGLGSYAAYGAQQTGARWLGVDFDRRALEIGREKAHGELGMTKDQVDYVELEHDGLAGALGDERFDCAVMQEVLEHVAAPWEVAQAVEARVAKDGWVYITVPVGPWEFMSYFTYPHRAHIWHFDLHDLRDMFGKKPDFSADVLHFTRSNEIGSAVGWWLARYRADGKPVGKIDMNRKRWLMRPRETLSVNIIAGPKSEETLLWCLRSMKHVADEIVIGDCNAGPGLPQALRMLDELEPLRKWSELIRVVKAPSPLEVGFDQARNAVLQESRMDWVMWIDTDERLIGEGAVSKYLRSNCFDGYGVRQHHFSVDTNLGADLPVRFFRRLPRHGEPQMRFWGCIHEHPERAVNAGPGEVVVMSDVHVAHVGYLIEGTRQQRFVRNFPLLKMDQERYPDRLLQKHFIMRDKVQLARFAIQQNGNKIDEPTRQSLRDVVKLYRDHFLGKAGYTNSDSRQYYSEALAMLGEGFEVVWSIAADKVSAKPNGTMTYRYATQEDLLADMNRTIREKTDSFGARYW